jgi:hypothetical protein
LSLPVAVRWGKWVQNFQLFFRQFVFRHFGLRHQIVAPIRAAQIYQTILPSSKHRILLGRHHHDTNVFSTVCPLINNCFESPAITEKGPWDRFSSKMLRLQSKRRYVNPRKSEEREETRNSSFSVR